MLTEAYELRKMPWTIERIDQTLETFIRQKHTQYENELMSENEAVKKMKSLGYNDSLFGMRNKRSLSNWMDFFKNYGVSRIKRIILMKKLPYPLLGGYSDWFILPKEDMDVVSRKFGVTAAMGLFVEIAIPTIMHLYCKNVRHIKETGYKDGSIWDIAVLEKIGDQYEWSINKLLEDFPRDKLYLHPIKLSKWN